MVGFRTSQLEVLVQRRLRYVDERESNRVKVDERESNRVKIVETDARGNETTRWLDALGREVQTDHPASAEVLPEVMTYDGEALRLQTDAQGVTTELTYDAVNRVTRQRELPALGDGRTFEQQWRYDDDARTVTHVDRRGSETEETREGGEHVTSFV